MKILRYLIILLAGIGIAGSQLARAANTDNAFSFLSIGEGARPAGMGEAFTALADDANALYWNPAGLGTIRSHEFTSSYLQYLVDVNVGYAGYALPVSKGGLGASVMYVDYGAIKALTYDDPSAAPGSYRPYDLVIAAGYGREIDDRVRAGFSVKGIYEEIKGYTAQAVAADAGLLYITPVEDLRLGFTLQNLGMQTKAFVEERNALPVTCRIGAGYGLLDDALQLAVDYYRRGNATSGLNAGIEYMFNHLIALRVGYQTRGQDLKTGSGSDPLTGITAGLGVRYGCLDFDYAFVPYNELGQTQRISLSFRFGERTRTAVPETDQRSDQYED
jgi:hypothetical protein